jgi:hypothetical protein
MKLVGKNYKNTQTGKNKKTQTALNKFITAFWEF